MKIVAGRFVAVLLFASGCSTAPRTAEPEAAPVAVSLGEAEVTDVASWFEAGGVVRAKATALVASRIAAPIAEIHVRVGDRVRRGAALVTLDAREMQAGSAARSASARSADQAIRAADADVSAAESSMALAQVTYDRMSGLATKRSATPQELDQAIAGLKAAEAQAAGARARQAAANAARDAARSTAEAGEIAATYAVLSAPFDGIVTGRHADPGSMATPGVPLLMVEDPSAFRLEVDVDEARATLVAVGQTVDVRVDALAPGDAWSSGQVAEIGRMDSGASFLVKINLPAAPGLRSGLFGRGRFATSTRRALTAPVSALVSRGQLTFVFLLDRDGRARLRPVSIGGATADRVEVLAGLHEHDQIVTSPAASLTDGARIAGSGR